MRRHLVLGASGYVGSRLVATLNADGQAVRALSRDPERLKGAGLPDGVEVVGGDVVCGAGLAEAMRDVEVVHHLVHSLSDTDFAGRDRAGAHNVAAAASTAGVRRIVYLGGLAPPADEVPSEHLASRAEVGEILLAGAVLAVVLRAGVIIGAGSASFDLLQELVPCADSGV